MRALRNAAALVAVGLALAACGGGDDPADASATCKGKDFKAGTTMARLHGKKQITIGTKFDQPLFGLKDLSGKPQGFDVEIGKIIACELAIPASDIDWVETPSAVREEMIEGRRVDMVVATYTITGEREKRVSFAGPYYEAGQDLMVKQDNTVITGPESLRSAKVKVCTVNGSTSAKEIRGYIDESQLVLFDVYSMCADALRTGQVEVVTTDNVILLGLIDDSDGAFKLVGKPFKAEPYGIGFKWGDVAFCQFIHDALRTAVADGRYQAAWEKTAGRVAEDVPRLPRLRSCPEINKTR